MNETSSWRQAPRHHPCQGLGRRRAGHPTVVESRTPATKEHLARKNFTRMPSNYSRAAEMSSVERKENIFVRTQAFILLDETDFFVDRCDFLFGDHPGLESTSERICLFIQAALRKGVKIVGDVNSGALSVQSDEYALWSHQTSVRLLHKSNPPLLYSSQTVSAVFLLLVE